MTSRSNFGDDPTRILDLSHDLISVSGMDGHFTYINPAGERILGYSNEELLNTSFLELIHPDDLERTRHEVEKLAEGIQTLDFENRYIAKDGTIRHIAWTAAPLVGEQRIYSIGRDITKRVEMEEALRESEKSLRQLIDQSPLPIQQMDPHGVIIRINPAWMELWDIGDDDLQTVLDDYNVLQDEQIRERGVMPLIEKAFAGESSELPMMEYDGGEMLVSLGLDKSPRQRWIQVRIYPVKDRLGEISSVVMIEEDVSLRKTAEDEASRYRKKLRDLANQLTISEERERRRIATDLHDHVCQTLALMRLDLGAVQAKVDDPGLGAQLDDLSELLLKANRDTRHLMADLSPPSLTELGLVAAINELLEEELEQQHGIDFDLHTSNGIADLGRDVRGMLFRSVRELLTNVVKHAQAGKVVVRIDQEDSNLSVRVEDDGCGFDPERISARSRENAGFGLFSIQERMSDMGGLLEINSIPGAGTRMNLQLPVKHAD